MSAGRVLVVFVLLGLAVGLGAVVYGGSREGERRGIERPTVAAPAERVRVEVLNAAGVSGLARTATIELRDAGFDVVHFGNARAFDRDSSVVIDRVDRPDLARAVANALGIGNVLTEPDPNLFVEVTVLLGRTWSAPAGGTPPRESGRRAPWDPRGWLGR